MRFKIVARNYKVGYFLLRLENGKVVRDNLQWVPWKVSVGITGRIIPGPRGDRMIPDAIDFCE